MNKDWILKTIISLIIGISAIIFGYALLSIVDKIINCNTL